MLFRGFVWASKLGLEAYFGQWHNVVTMDVLYSSYAEFAKSRHERHPLSREWFGQFINKMGGAPTRPRDEVIGEHLADVPNSYGGTTPKAELVRHPRPHAYALGSLTKARAAFDDATRLTTDWPPDPADTDPIDAFTKSECVTGPGIGVRVEILFKAWVMWCAEQKEIRATSTISVRHSGMRCRASISCNRRTRRGGTSIIPRHPAYQFWPSMRRGALAGSLAHQPRSV